MYVNRLGNVSWLTIVNGKESMLNVVFCVLLVGYTVCCPLHSCNIVHSFRSLYCVHNGCLDVYFVLSYMFAVLLVCDVGEMSV